MLLCGYSLLGCCSPLSTPYLQHLYPIKSFILQLRQYYKNVMEFSKMKKDQRTTLATFIRWKSLDFTPDTDHGPRNSDVYLMLPLALTGSFELSQLG